MPSWMTELAAHYEAIRQRYPEASVMLLLDIDGTIVDMRSMVWFVLKRFDAVHRTSHFRELAVDDIQVYEGHVDALLEERGVPENERRRVLDWYERHRWATESILESHRPFAGVLEMIRWFQIQPHTVVGLNTGRPESLRRDTLRSLNALGREYKVVFTSELLHMNARDWEQGVQDAKVEGLRKFQEAGYRIFAFIDNEPSNLRAVGEADNTGEILLLHADTLFASARAQLPPAAVGGASYDFTKLISPRALPRHIQFVWHGVNVHQQLDAFLASDVQWGECDARIDPITNDVILRHHAFGDRALAVGEAWLTLGELLRVFAVNGKCAKIDVKSGGRLIDDVLAIVAAEYPDDQGLWFNGNVERLQEEGFRRLAAAHPDAILQCPVDFLAPLIDSVPDKAQEILARFSSWGVNRFSIDWQAPRTRVLMDRMDTWGYEVNIYNVPDLETFLRAVVLLPRSITSDFHFRW